MRIYTHMRMYKLHICTYAILGILILKFRILGTPPCQNFKIHILIYVHIYSIHRIKLAHTAYILHIYIAYINHIIIAYQIALIRVLGTPPCQNLKFPNYWYNA